MSTPPHKRMPSITIEKNSLPENNNSVFHILLGFNVAVWTVAITIYQDYAPTWFLFHVLFMILAFSFMTRGMLQYQSFGDQNKRNQERYQHLLSELLAALFCVLGLVAILGSRILKGKQLIPHSLHSIIGAAVLCIVAFQVAVGLRKYYAKLHGSPPMMKWHGRLGLLLQCGMFLSVVTGAQKIFMKWDARICAVMILLQILVELTFVYLVRQRENLIMQQLQRS